MAAWESLTPSPAKLGMDSSLLLTVRGEREAEHVWTPPVTRKAAMLGTKTQQGAPQRNPEETDIW